MNPSNLAEQLNEDNFRTCYFQKGEMRGFTSEGAGPHPHNPEDIVPIYWVTMRSEEWGDVEQREFNQLAPALTAANKLFASWDFVDLSEKLKAKGGCSTCVAKH